MERRWINQPSTLQPYHRWHGVNVLFDRLKDRAWFLSGPVSNITCESRYTSPGWREEGYPSEPREGLYRDASPEEKRALRDAYDRCRRILILTPHADEWETMKGDYFWHDCRYRIEDEVFTPFRELHPKEQERMRVRSRNGTDYDFRINPSQPWNRVGQSGHFVDYAQYRKAKV